VYVCVYTRSLVKVPLFQDMPEDFLCELSMHVVHYVFSPGEVIINSDEPVHEIYIIQRGICQVFKSRFYVKVCLEKRRKI